MPPPSKEFSDIRYVLGNARDRRALHHGPGRERRRRCAAARQRAARQRGRRRGRRRRRAPKPQGLPYLKPPYGRITAIDMQTGEFVWQVAHGETPDFVRNHPALKGSTSRAPGRPARSASLVTKTLVIAGEPQVTTLPGRPRGAMLRAYDKATGKEVGAVYLPAQQSGSPMTYMLNGRQYIVVAVSGGNYSGEYLAFRLPEQGK